MMGVTTSRSDALEASLLQQATDRYINQVLGVVESLPAGDPMEPSEVHRLLRQLLEQSGQELGGSTAWRFNLYALVAWTDEILLNTPWAGQVWWSNHVLEVEFFGTRICSEKFYLMAQELAGVPPHPSLRTFYLCVLLGFRGIYRFEAPASAMELGLPATLAEWMAQMRRRIRAHQAIPMPVNLQRRLAGAAPHNAREHIVWWSIAVTALIMLNVTAYAIMK